MLQTKDAEIVELRTKSREAYDIANHVLERTRVAQDENAHLKKTNLDLSAHLHHQYALDDNINVRCFLDSYSAAKAFQEERVKGSSEVGFGMGALLKHSFERLYRPGRSSIHSMSHERTYATVASSLMRKKLDPAVDTV
jgi:hypothetical protein